MKLVSENSESDIKKRAASEEFEQKLEGLAINMLRVIAGAGEPARLLRDIHECALATREYRDVHSEYPSAFQIAKLLDLHTYDREQWESWSDAERERWLEDGTFAVQIAAARIRQASLRIVAAQWAGQKTVLSNADRLFFEATKSYDDAKEFHRKEIANR
jgi:hypothetical protein